MKFIIVLLVTILAVNALTEKENWIQFKEKHGKNYQNIIEENYRYSVFQQNLREINEHNELYAKGESTYSLGINKFADQTPEEFRNRFKHGKLNKPQPAATSSKILSRTLRDDVPTALDWRDKGVVLPVRDQGDCGGSFGFSSSAALESQIAISNNEILQMSPQYLIDCAAPPTGGCDYIGDCMSAFYYGMSFVVVTEKDYPFVGAQQLCRNVHVRNFSIHEIQMATETEGFLQTVVANDGPVASTINADCIQFYSSGIYSNITCPNNIDDINYGVLIVGYDTDSTGTDYWIIKNSWGTTWGEEGYMRLRRGNYELGVNLMNAVPLQVREN